jgi:methylated-DNA-[protein]-cysteine S-methyltransferase
MYARDHALIATPIGTVRVEGDETAITRVSIGGDEGSAAGTAAAVRDAAEQIGQWFAGERRGFEIALAPPATLRGAALRQGMIDIGFGETRSYGALAAQLGSSPRAIGQACARNPFPLIVPCHRVLGAGGALGHYSAGDGATTKSWLLGHERRHSGGTLI